VELRQYRHVLALARPNFSDTITLPRGEYRVELTLHGIPPDFPRHTIQKGEDMHKRAWQKLSRSVQVRVGD
jgi:hypothetical protein